MTTRWYAPSADMGLPRERGPFRPDMVKDGDRYEISRGHPVYSAPAGGRHGNKQLVGALPIATDPAVTEAGIDVGYATDEHTLRAPDLAVGNVPDRPGWVSGAPALAIEYADRGTDEDELQSKIRELHAAGTQLIWVVRLVGPRRVDVYGREREPFTVGSGGLLDAEGHLSQPLPVDALFDPDRANEVALNNLLRRGGHGTIDEVRAKGRSEGRSEGLRTAIETACGLLDIPVEDARRAWLDVATLPELETLLSHLRTHREWP